jgi:hypothetical protein
MTRTSWFVRILATLGLMAVLSACSMGQTPAPTATAVDVNAVITAAAATAYAQLTQIASLATPTLAPTEAPTETPAQGATAAATDAGLLPVVTVQVIVTTEAPTAALGGVAETPTLPAIPGLTAIPSLTPVPTISLGGAVATTTGPVCKKMTFVADITIPDGTAMKPWEKFTKIWRMQNTGTCTWDEGFIFKAFAGSNLGKGEPYKIKYENQFVKPGDIVDIGIDFFAPGDPGEYIQHWSWYDDVGQAFPQSVTVVIKVVK